MSSSDVKIEKQTHRHRGPLVGIALGGVFVVVIMVFMLTNLLDGEAADPEAPASATVTQ